MLPQRLATVLGFFVFCLAVWALSPSAHAAVCPEGFQCCSYVRTDHSAICTEWTGGWPNGVVRAQTGYDWYRIRLQTCTSTTYRLQDCSPWVTLATSAPHYTPWFHVGKANWYRVCGQLFDGADWLCQGSREVVYLGD